MARGVEGGRRVACGRAARPSCGAPPCLIAAAATQPLSVRRAGPQGAGDLLLRPSSVSCGRLGAPGGPRVIGIAGLVRE